ncbi:UNVERIFIED_CONTAM: hypothetical protein [Bacteriophage sp.]
MIQFEHTDLYAGEANYSWVRRTSIEDTNLSDKAIVRRAKAWAGLTGLRCKVENWGDMLRIDASPSGLLHVVFVTYE